MGVRRLKEEAKLVILNIQSQNFPALDRLRPTASGCKISVCKRQFMYSEKERGYWYLKYIYIWKKKGSVEEGRKLSLFRLEDKYFRRSMNITNNPKQDSCAKDM